MRSHRFVSRGQFRGCTRIIRITITKARTDIEVEVTPLTHMSTQEQEVNMWTARLPLIKAMLDLNFNLKKQLNDLIHFWFIFLSKCLFFIIFSSAVIQLQINKTIKKAKPNVKKKGDENSVKNENKISEMPEKTFLLCGMEVDVS